MGHGPTKFNTKILWECLTFPQYKHEACWVSVARPQQWVGRSSHKHRAIGLQQAVGQVSRFQIEGNKNTSEYHMHGIDPSALLLLQKLAFWNEIQMVVNTI